MHGVYNSVARQLSLSRQVHNFLVANFVWVPLLIKHFIAYCMHIICRVSFSTLWILTVQIKHSLLICFCQKHFTVQQ